MHTDKYGQIIVSEDDLCNHFLTDPNQKISVCLTDTDIHIDDILDLSDLPKFTKYIDPSCSIGDFDRQNQNKWFMPDEYEKMDIALYVLEKCNTNAELQRAGEELFLFQERNLFPLLRYLKYLVDTMKANNVVYGVGRGSSVASFVLFLIGIHRINSLYYDLPIDEFLK